MIAATVLVSAWVVGYNPVSIQRFEQNAKKLDIVFMEYYAVDRNGLPTRRKEYAETYKRARTIAKQNRVQFYVMINNYANEPDLPNGFDTVRMTKALATPESRNALATGLVNMVVEDEAEGVDLDLESLSGADRDRYSSFVTQLGGMLRAKKLKLSVTVHAKEEVMGSWDAVKAHDYAALGSIADRFNVMTYDYNWSGSPKPGPIAPTAWVERVMNFTKSQMNPRKIGMGVAAYGYDWNKSPATSLVWEDFKNQKLVKDPLSGEYTANKIYFSGGAAFQEKYALANKLGIGSVAFWYCGSEDPGIWSFLPTRR